MEVIGLIPSSYVLEHSITFLKYDGRASCQSNFRASTQKSCFSILMPNRGILWTYVNCRVHENANKNCKTDDVKETVTA